MSENRKFLVLQEAAMPGGGRVRTVVDSTACLMPEVARKLDITVVPIGHDINENAVTTSTVSSLRLCAAYACALKCSNEDGPDAGVIVLHLGKGVSATWSNAIITAGVLDRVTVIDTDTVRAGVDTAAIAATKTTRAGASCDEVADVARDVLQRYRLWLFVPKPDSLRRGGRISTGQTMFSMALVIKPIVGTKDGLLALVAKCWAEAKVKQRMVDFTTEVVRSTSSTNCSPVVLLHHSDTLNDVHEPQVMLAEGLSDSIRSRILDLSELLTTHVGQGAHAASMISGDSADSDAVDFETGTGVTAPLYGAEENDMRVTDTEATDTVDDDSGNINNSSDFAGTNGSVENAGATNSGEPITDQAEAKIVENPAANRNRNKRIYRTVVTNEQGIPLFATAVSELPTRSENRQATLDKTERLVKAILDLALRDRPDPEGVAFGTGGEKSQELLSGGKRDDDGNEKKKQFLGCDDGMVYG